MRQPAANRSEFAEPVGDVNCNSIRFISTNFRMRLAKGFFLSFLAVECLRYRRRPPTAGQPPANGEEFAEPVGDVNCSSTSTIGSNSQNVLAANSQNASGKKYTNFGSFFPKLLKF